MYESLCMLERGQSVHACCNMSHNIYQICRESHMCVYMQMSLLPSIVL